MNTLKEAKERRGKLVKDMENLLNKAKEEKRDLTPDEIAEFDKWDSEATTLEEETIPRLERMEARQAQIAKETAERRSIGTELSTDPNKEQKGQDSPHVEVTNNHLKTKEARNVNTFKLIKGQMSKNAVMVNEARKKLAEGGHYDDLLDGSEKRSFDTLIDENGAVLIPTTVTQEIISIMQEYGVIPRLARNLGDISQNNVKIPQVLGRPAFYAVSQGGAIQGSGFNLGAIELKALKWGCIIPWTNEVSDSVASTLMPIIMQQTAEGYAYVQDNVFFNGTGTSTYNGIKGLEGLTGSVNYVRTATAASGNNTFATLDAEDFLLPQQNVAPGTRSGSVYVMHPNMIFTLRKLKDGQGKFIYGDPSEIAPAGTLWGHPIETSEAFAYTDGATKTVCAFFNPRFVAYATGRNLSADQLSEGTITDEDDNSVNLATTDKKALRFTGLFDLMLSTVTRSTAGTAQGAFSVLRTNS